MITQRVLLILATAVLILGCQAKTQDPASIKAGDVYVLQSQYYDYTTVWATLGMAEPKEAAHKPEQIKDMVEKEALYDPPNGVKVKVLDWKGERERADLRKVEIMDGDFKGKEGWVPYTTLQAPK
jgi:hypothetical protein